MITPFYPDWRLQTKHLIFGAYSRNPRVLFPALFGGLLYCDVQASDLFLSRNNMVQVRRKFLLCGLCRSSLFFIHQYADVLYRLVTVERSTPFDTYKDLKHCEQPAREQQKLQTSIFFSRKIVVITLVY